MSSLIPDAPLSPKKRRGAPDNNKNRETHGFYSQPAPLPKVPEIKVPEIDDLISGLNEKLDKVSLYIEGTSEPEEMLKAIGLYAQGVSRLGRLLRDKQVLGGGGGNALDMLGLALDELSDELGVTL